MKPEIFYPFMYVMVFFTSLKLIWDGDCSSIGLMTSAYTDDLMPFPVQDTMHWDPDRERKSL
jgi:hypothetical protein